MKLLLTLQDTAEQLDVFVRSVRRNSPYYWASYIDVRGRRVRRSTGVQKSREGRREAKALLAKWKLEIHREKQWDEKPSRTFDELLVRYLKATQNVKRAAARGRTVPGTCIRSLQECC